MANSSLDKQMIAFGILLLTGCSPVQRAPTPASTTMVIPDEHYVGEVVQPPILLQDFTMPASTGQHACQYGRIDAPKRPEWFVAGHVLRLSALPGLLPYDADRIQAGQSAAWRNG